MRGSPEGFTATIAVFQPKLKRKFVYSSAFSVMSYLIDVLCNRVNGVLKGGHEA
jgi:hypothetical protein